MTPIVIPKEENKTIAICTPCHSGDMNICHHVAIMNILLSGIFRGAQEYLPSKSGIASARNHCIWWARKNGFRYVFFSDSDTEPQPWQLKRLVDRGVPVVGGLYSHKSRELRWCLNPKRINEGEEFAEVIKEVGPMNGLMPVATIGTGAMLIDLEKVFPAIEKHFDLYDPNFPLVYKEDQERERDDGSSPAKGEMVPCFFQERPVYYKPWKTYRKLTEDWFFCYLCQEAGVPIYADCTFHVPHEGYIKYPLNEPDKENSEEVETQMR